MRRLAALLILTAILGWPAHALAGDVTSTTNPAVPERDIIPAPNSGVAPTESGDRGGAAQFVVLGAIVVGLTTIGVLAWRSARRARGPASG